MNRCEYLSKLLEACKNTKSLYQLHSLFVKTGNIYDSFFASKLNCLYCKYAHTYSARKLFDETPVRTVYTWNSIVGSYFRDKRYKEVLSLFSRMVESENPDSFTIPLVLKACISLQEFEFGRKIHGFVKKNVEIDPNLFVGSSLVELYSKCGNMDDALRVFEEYSRPDIVLWTTMVTAYEQNGYPEEALSFFTSMVARSGINPDTVTLVSVVSACTQSLNHKVGSSVHGFFIRRGLENALSLSNALLNLYAKTGSVHSAVNLFRQMEEKDVISWGSMVACYAHNGAATKALCLFNEMLDNKLEPNAVTVISALQACEMASNLEQGKKIHEIASQRGFELDILVSSALVDMYMNCSSPNEAIELFNRMPKRDVVSWSAVLCGCVQNGMAHKSMGVFCNMLFNGIQPDAITMVKILASCAELGILQQASCLHGYVLKCGFYNNPFVGASLLESYSKSSDLDNAIKVFQGVKVRDVVVWSSMVAGYGFHGRGREALEIFYKMVNDPMVKPNNVTFLSVLSACSHTGLVKEGIELFNLMVHGYQLIPDSKHYGIMVDLLGRTGELDKAMNIINQMPVQVGPHVWGALLGASRVHGNTELGEVAARNLFHLDPSHSGYYILLSNIYAVDGKWDNVARLRTLVKEQNLKKMIGQSIVEVRNEIHSFVACDRLHPKCDQIYRLLRKLEVKMREEGYVPDVNFLVPCA